MKVLDLLKLADIEVQTDFFCRETGNKTKGRVEVKELVTKFIDDLLHISPKRESCIIIFEKYWDDNEGKSVFDVYPECYYKEEIDEYLENIKGKPCPVNEYNEDMDESSLKKLVLKFDSFPVSYAFEFIEWETILGWEVYTGNIEELGLQKCIYSILYEMSFNGMTREEQEKRREELDESIKEFDEIKKLPQKEQEKCFITFEEMKECWKKEFGWEEPSKKEIEEEERRTWLNCLKTSIWRYQNFQKMKI